MLEYPYIYAREVLREDLPHYVIHSNFSSPSARGCGWAGASSGLGLGRISMLMMITRTNAESVTVATSAISKHIMVEGPHQRPSAYYPT